MVLGELLGLENTNQAVARASTVQMLSNQLVLKHLFKETQHVLVLLLQDRGPSKGQPKFEMQKGEFLSATRGMSGEEEKLGLEWGFLHPPAAHLSSRAWHRGRGCGLAWGL